MSASTAERSPLYPYELALVNAILALLAVAAIFDDKPTELRFSVIMAVTLAAIGTALLIRTERTGYLPSRVETDRLRGGRRNIAGWSTVALVAVDVLLVPGIFFG